jgi:single-strand DNA-binding protein
MMNKVILIGRLANDPELKYTPSGIPVTTFRLAVDRPISAEARQSGQEKQADFIDIVAWRQAAEFASNYLGKGRLVAIEGRLQIRQYQANDGTNRRNAEVVVDQLKSLERPRDPANGDADNHGGGGYRGGGESGGYGGGGGGYGQGNEEGGGARRSPAPQQQRGGYQPRQPGPPPAPAGAAASEPGAEHDPFSDDLDDPFADE